MRQELRDEKHIRVIVNLISALMATGTAFEFYEADACIEDEIINNGDFLAELTRKRLYAIIPVHVELHDLDDGPGIVGPNAEILAERFGAGLSLGGVSDSEDDG
jgi:hypothetical protein